MTDAARRRWTPAPAGRPRGPGGKRVVPPLLAGTPPAGLDSYATLVIQALDLGFIVPTAILTGVLLLRRAALGYLLASVVLILGLTMGAALLALRIAQKIGRAHV